MGLNSSKIPDVTPTAECKVLVHGSDWLSAHEVMLKLRDGDVPFAEGWSTDRKTRRDKFVDVFPWFNGGRSSERAVFQSVYGSADALIFLFNRHYKNDLDYAHFMLELMLKEDGLENAVVVVLANDRRDEKNDNSEEKEKTEEELKEAIGFNNIPLRHKPTYLNCSAKTGDGLDKVVEYLTKQLMSDTKEERHVEKVPEVKPEVVKSSMIKQVMRTLKWIKPSVPKTA